MSDTIAFSLDVLGSGAVILGDEVVCDGFHRTRPYRVQTHVHDDHMLDFDTSKGFQDLLMSQETYDLLLAQFNADLLVRENLHPLRYGQTFKVGSCHVSLLPSDHMLGSAQVAVELASGFRLGYSGDFQWPMHQPMEVEALVVDSTYGSPESIRRYTQADAESRFIEIIHASLMRGSVHVQAHRGTIQRAVQLLGSEVSAPLICSKRLMDEIVVYQRFGSCVTSVFPIGGNEATSAIAEGRYVHLYSKGDKCPDPLPEGTRITLSAYMARPDNPVLEYSERSYRVALSNHADFLGTLEYIQATHAKYVITDNTRGRGIELAGAINHRLGVSARPSSNSWSREWGAG